MLDIALAIVTAAAMIALAVLGGLVAATKRWHRFAFLAIGVAGLSLVTWQAYRSQEAQTALRRASYRVKLRVFATEILRAADAAEEGVQRAIKTNEEILQGSLNEAQRQIYETDLEWWKSRTVAPMDFEGFYQSLRGLLDEMKAADFDTTATERLLQQTRGVWLEPKSPPRASSHESRVAPHWETDVVKVRAFARHLQALADKLK